MSYAQNYTRGTGGQHPSLRGLVSRRLGDASSNSSSTAISPQAALQQAMANATNLNPADWNNPQFLSTVYDYIESGNISAVNFSPACSGIIAQNPDLSLTQAAGSLAAGGVGVAAAAGALASSIAAPVTLGLTAVVAIVTMIFQHHAQAAHQEQELGCIAIAGFNNAMNAIAEGVRGGSISPADAANALNAVYSNFQSAIAPSYSVSPFCSADCEAEVQAQAVVIFWQSQYAAQAQQLATVAAEQATAQAQNSGGATSALSPPAIPLSQSFGPISSAVDATGIPTWALLLGAAVVAWAVL